MTRTNRIRNCWSLRFCSPEPTMTAALELRDVGKSFTMHLQGGLRLSVLSGISFFVRPGECMVLGGRSGLGKSTVLKMIFGNYRCDSGQILVRDGGEVVDVATA